MKPNTLTFSITSTRPLLMQAALLANPLSHVTKAHKAVSGKRKKTEEDYLWLLRDEWESHMYHDDSIGPYLPSINLEACIAEAAKATKQGKVIKQAVTVPTERIPLAYDGPRDKPSLYSNGDSAFIDVRGVNIVGKKVMRARPIFREWQCEFELSFMDDMIDARDLIRIVEHAGRVIGVGTYRPRFGRFDVASVQ